MNKKLKICSLNLCNECSGKDKTNKRQRTMYLIELLNKTKPDIIFLQEIKHFIKDILDLLDEKTTNLTLLNLNKKEETAILINPFKLKKIAKYHVKLIGGRKLIYLGNLHLNDTPCIIHHINGVVYKGLPKSTPTSQVVKQCAKNRLPRVNKELRMSSKTRTAIIAGDFNEPSHLDFPGDPDLKALPVSNAFKKDGFRDTYYSYINPKNTNKINMEMGYTWGVGGMYDNEPRQRIDFIYTRNVKVLSSKTYDTNPGFKTDHKMVITEIEV